MRDDDVRRRSPPARRVLIGGYAIVGLLVKRLYINGATATLLLALAFGATAAGEFVREGARKPYTVRGVLYSTRSRRPRSRSCAQTGATADDPYPLRDDARYPNDAARARRQGRCARCATRATRCTARTGSSS